MAADFAVNTLKTKRVAMAPGKPMRPGLADEFRRWYKRQVVYYGGFPRGTNFKPIISAVRETNPGLWFFGGIYQAGPMVVRRAAGLTAVFMSGDGVIDRFSLRWPAHRPGSYLTFSAAEDVPAMAFLDKYHKQSANTALFNLCL